VWRTLRIAATGTKSLALVGTGQRAGRGFEEEEASVVGPHGAEDAFVREAFGGGEKWTPSWTAIPVAVSHPA
jgi:hypothetical protein